MAERRIAAAIIIVLSSISLALLTVPNFSQWAEGDHQRPEYGSFLLVLLNLILVVALLRKREAEFGRTNKRWKRVLLLCILPLVFVALAIFGVSTDTVGSFLAAATFYSALLWFDWNTAQDNAAVTDAP